MTLWTLALATSLWASAAAVPSPFTSPGGVVVGLAQRASAANAVGAVAVPAAPATNAPLVEAQVGATAAFGMEDAVAVALRRNRTVVAAQLEVDAALIDELAARIYTNPRLEYTLGNLVLGAGNPQDIGLRPSFFEQNNQSVGISQAIDIWRKRQGRAGLARQHGETRRCGVEDALREVAYVTRARFAEVLREQAELALMVEARRGYAQTVSLMQRREAAGDIARTDLDKIELEALRYTQLVLQAERELADARAALAEVMALADAASLPVELYAQPMPNAAATTPDAEAVLARALRQRPDVRAAKSEWVRAGLSGAVARRETLPDLTVGLNYTRSHFQISGDNPHALGVQLGIDLPVFDRNQAARRQASVARQQADNAMAHLAHEVTHEVMRALRGWKVASDALHVFEDGGMLERAQRARAVAQRSFAAGATSLLELLEAERTYLDTRADYLRTLDAWRQAHIDVAHVTGGSPP